MSISGDKNEGADFPVVYWPQWKCRASFTPSPTLPACDASSLYAVLGFLFKGDKVVLAHIPQRGHCIPSGRIERGEDPVSAMVREAYEEAGALLQPEQLIPIGWYSLVSPDADAVQSARVCPVFIARAETFTDIPQNSESDAIRLATLEEIPTIYFTWDDLIAAVFKFASEEVLRHHRD